MKKIDMFKTISLLANLGVIAGIIFLALEVQQNNELMRVSVREAQSERVRHYAEQVYTVPGLAEILVKVENGEPLTEVERVKFLNRQLRQLRGFEAQWREFVAGTTNSVMESEWNRWFYEGVPFYSPPQIETWNELKMALNPGFVQYVEENVVGNEK